MRLFLVAGEPSGDALGAALMAGLKRLAPDVTFAGVGGPLMIAEGMDSLFPMQELSVMGLIEVLPKYRHLKRRIAETAAACVAARPDALVTIDSPDFSFRVARAVRAAAPQVRTIHYVAPSVWAWRPGRAAKMAAFTDHVMALLPFEPPYMRAAGMTCDFVGHPVVAQPRASEAEVAAFRETHMIAEDQPVILCLPGSRRGEVRRLMPMFEDVLMRVRDREPRLRVLLPTVPGVAADVGRMAATWPEPPLVLLDPADKRAAFGAATVALAASGTVSLELAANRLPMVIAYDVAWVTREILLKLVKLDTVTLVNLVSETRAIPEFIGRNCKPAPISRVLAHLLEDEGARGEQTEAMDLTMERLGRGGDPPGLRAARSVIGALGRVG